MNEAVFNLLMAVVTAAVTALSAFAAAFVKKKGEEAAAQTNSILLGERHRGSNRYRQYRCVCRFADLCR